MQIIHRIPPNAPPVFLRPTSTKSPPEPPTEPLTAPPLDEEYTGKADFKELGFHSSASLFDFLID